MLLRYRPRDPSRDRLPLIVYSTFFFRYFVESWLLQTKAGAPQPYGLKSLSELGLFSAQGSRHVVHTTIHRRQLFLFPEKQAPRVLYTCTNPTSPKRRIRNGKRRCWMPFCLEDDGG